MAGSNWTAGKALPYVGQAFEPDVRLESVTNSSST